MKYLWQEFLADLKLHYLQSSLNLGGISFGKPSLRQKSIADF